MDLKGGGNASPIINSNNLATNDCNNVAYIEVMHTENNNDSNISMEQGTSDINKIVKKSSFKYSYKCKGPFEVYLESNNDNKNIGNFHNLRLAKFVYDLGFSDVKKILKKGRNRISVAFKNFGSANDFLDRFKDDPNYNVFIPGNRTTCKGLIKQVDLDFSLDDLKKYISTNIQDIDIIDCRRLNRRKKLGDTEIEYVPTGTVCITFTGTALPREITICNLVFPVIPYILPVVQCFKCLLYGHTKKICRGKDKCSVCGINVDNHTNEGCHIKCVHCDSLDHNSLNRSCPEFSRQKRIKEIMSLDNKNFFEASEMVPRIRQSPNKNSVAPIFRQDDFPHLNSHSSSHVTTEINERRAVASLSLAKQQYSHIVSTPKKRKQLITSGEGYSRDEINNCLFSPNGRPSQYLSGNSSLINANQPPSRFESLSRDISPLHDPMSQQILKEINQLHRSDRDKILDYITQLKVESITNNRVISTTNS